MAKRMSEETFQNLVSIGFGKPPRWCSKAVATDAGWTNPKTGEILMASRGLASRINEFEAEKQMRAIEAAKKAVKTKKVDVPFEMPVLNVVTESELKEKEEVVSAPVVEEKTQKLSKKDKKKKKQLDKASDEAKE